MILFQKQEISVRQLEPEDASLLVKWLSNPAVLEYYEGRDRPHNMGLVQQHFFENREGITQCIVQFNQADIGFIQFYEIDEEEREKYDYSNDDGQIYGMDQFIGETDFWNRGIGTRLIKVVVNYLIEHRAVNKIVMDPQAWNTRALRVYEKNGFVKKKYLEKHEWHEGEYRDCWLIEYNGIKDIIRAAKELSINAVLKAGQVAKDHFDNFTELQEKDDFGDVVTEVDLKAEEIILNEIISVFPDHQIDSEESGNNGKKSDWVWMVDPLDGTNNFAIGLPIFSTSVTLMYQSEPVLGVIYEPLVNRLYVASKTEGAFCNNNRLQVKKKVEIKKGTIGWIQGHKVQNDEVALRLRQHLDTHFKRMMRLWAPTLQWAMLAKGDLDGIVLFNSEGDDLYSGILMVKEAGGIVMEFDGNPFNGMNEEPYLIACHPEHKDYFLKVVKEGLDHSEG